MRMAVSVPPSPEAAVRFTGAPGTSYERCPETSAEIAAFSGTKIFCEPPS